MSVLFARLLFLTIIGVYLTQNRPSLILSQLEEENSARIAAMSWDDIRDQVFSMPIKTTDTHLFKIVQVCHGAARARPEKEELYKRACLNVMENPMTRMALKPKSIKTAELH